MEIEQPTGVQIVTCVEIIECNGDTVTFMIGTVIGEDSEKSESSYSCEEGETIDWKELKFKCPPPSIVCAEVPCSFG